MTGFETNTQLELARAQVFLGVVATAIKAAGGPKAPPDRHYHFPDAFNKVLGPDIDMLAALPLPIDHNQRPDQVITLPADTDSGFVRVSSAKKADEVCAKQARTRIYEDVARGDTGWLGMAAQLLMKRVGFEMKFSIFDSKAGDRGLPPHGDNWHTTAVQFLNEKPWWLGKEDTPEIGKVENSGPPTLFLRAGGILVVPLGYPHYVAAQHDRSVHLTISTRLDRKLSPPGG